MTISFSLMIMKCVPVKSDLKACKSFGRSKTVWTKNAGCRVIHAIVIPSNAIASKME
jgi:hypothetical protein